MRVEIDQLTKHFGATDALEAVTLALPAGQIVAVLGSNGAGKTTLLRCLAGISNPDAGQIRFDGHVFSRDRLELRQRLGFVPDIPTLLPTNTLLQHIALVLRIYGATGPGAEHRVLELLERFEVLHVAERRPIGLSRGEAYKGALIAMLAADPELWVLDEPFASGMDPVGFSALKEEVRKAVARGRIVVYSTQLLELVEGFSDRVCILHQGRLVAFSATADLKAGQQGASDALRKVFSDLSEVRR